MRRSASPVPADERQAPGASRRVGATIVAALFIAAGFGVPHDVQDAERRGFTTAVTGNNGPARVPVVTRAAGVTPQLTASRPIRPRQLGLDGLALVAAAFAVFGGFRRRAEPGTPRRFDFDAVFALRRGPPMPSAVR